MAIAVAPSGWEGRGLKRNYEGHVHNAAVVAPSGWEGRGLKHHVKSTTLVQIFVAPSGWEGRGLKPSWADKGPLAPGSLLPVGRGVD